MSDAPGRDESRNGVSRRQFLRGSGLTAATAAFTGSICCPSPMAINEARNACPSIFPRTFTSPRVPKNFTDSGHIKYVHPPLFLLFCNLAVNFFFTILLPSFS